ncbi:precorrin-2 dehydrogenase / sirohydrochlorin ferrochelatase [Peptoclostridium litorale DSM 5388]|uniref:precorrin-2 dehydrogenase n=1 Tax=Peptoclostridium litorale DSM 5388 TaxID=1121324 RepID=A0A069RHP0_PEPLI|nr:bifunctional precorrin-2 dehydrogenase/sirohydrochlorin ferrochelatase [Peptoclostridium litorale]KDR96521.1 putative siroheme synthase [Peptoclostridium litorale DSM 5388]SIN69611.1 precorrin-2 dehydrogenase / sirohydrochlorin ferrochelatase [Peptoclostridium litorale DSM 5388]
MMPINIDVANKKVAVIGGGGIALRKVKRLLEFSAHVVVISPELCEGFTPIIENIKHIKGVYSKEHIIGCFMAIAASSSKDVNEKACNDCREMGILCSRSDISDEGDFTMPAVLKRESLVIGVSTCGCSPALSARIIRELKEKYTKEYGEHVALLGRARKALLQTMEDNAQRKKLLRDIIDMEKEEIMEVISKYE